MSQRDNLVEVLVPEHLSNMKNCTHTAHYCTVLYCTTDAFPSHGALLANDWTEFHPHAHPRSTSWTAPGQSSKNTPQPVPSARTLDLPLVKFFLSPLTMLTTMMISTHCVNSIPHGSSTTPLVVGASPRGFPTPLATPCQVPRSSRQQRTVESRLVGRLK